MKSKFQLFHLTRKLVFRAAFYKCNTHVFDIEYSLKKSDCLIRLKILVDIKSISSLPFHDLLKIKADLHEDLSKRGVFYRNLKSCKGSANLRRGGNIAEALN